MRHGYPASAGVALGYDRLLMWLWGCEKIDQVIAFRGRLRERRIERSPTGLPFQIPLRHHGGTFISSPPFCGDHCMHTSWLNPR